MHRVSLCVATMAALTTLGSGASAESAEDFYRGKMVQFVVGYGAGSGFDIYTRAAARFIDRHIPGNPNVIVQNMPGAASLTSVRYMATKAARDGTEIAMFNRGLIINSVLNPEIDVDFRTFTWIGSMNSEVPVCYLRASMGIDSLETFKASKVNIGDTTRASGGYVYASVLRSLTGDAVDIILGYPGTVDIRLAMERGELDGNCGVWSTLKQSEQWLAGDKINVLVQFAAEPHHELKEVPVAFAFVRSERERQALQFLVGAEPIGRPIIAPPGLPADRAAVLRAAFEKTMADPAFRAFTDQAKMDISVVTGERAAQIVDEIMATPTEAVKLANEMIQ